MTIYVSRDLQQLMRALPGVNWSSVAQSAFLVALGLERAAPYRPTTPQPDMEEIWKQYRDWQCNQLRQQAEGK